MSVLEESPMLHGAAHRVGDVARASAVFGLCFFVETRAEPNGTAGTFTGVPGATCSTWALQLWRRPGLHVCYTQVRPYNTDSHCDNVNITSTIRIF